MSIIDEHIIQTQKIIEGQDLVKAEEQYNFLLNIYAGKIKNYENGTTAITAKVNMIWNLNDGINLPVNIDYITDLKLVLQKIIIYREEMIEATQSKNVIHNHINNSGVINIDSNSNNVAINSDNQNNEDKDTKNKKKKSFWAIIGSIIGALAGIATITTLILVLCGII